MNTAPPTSRPDGTGLIAHDPWLEPYRGALQHRYNNYQRRLKQIEAAEGTLEKFATGHHYFGLNRGEKDGQPGVWYREWAPGAQALSLIGDFNQWNRQANPMARDDFGVWSTFLPDREYADRLRHDGAVKVHVVSKTGGMDRIPAYIRRVTYDATGSQFAGRYWNPPQPYQWQHAAPRIDHGLRIYEAHVGMALMEERVGTFAEFTKHILPRIARAGYNAVQLMAVMEHPYYASFGYQVNAFFAPSSRFGTPDDLKRLIDEAHRLGMVVFLDIVHSHAVKNVLDGLNAFDGTDHQYFHAPPRGLHSAWDSLVFDYGKWEVIRFLLSNARYWLEEYHFDGFRFDGVTSMMYLHHGLGRDFNHYDHYLVTDLDEDAVVYLQLANQLIHELNPAVISIAEDMSGMVGLARPLDEGGLGFDYRLAMGLPDYWIKLVTKKRDEDWSMNEMYHALMNRRHSEKHIAYVESHDQSLVGDKTLAFHLMDAAMYHQMNKGSQSPVIDRGMSLHKMIRLVTFALGGEGYLTFIGNEFGHPEWVDFPREGNKFSYKYARRQWLLVDDPLLRYHDLAAFDRAMMELDEKYQVLRASPIELIRADDAAHVLIARRGHLVFAFNFHPVHSVADYRLGVPDAHDYRLVLNSDDVFFGGHAIVQAGQRYPVQHTPFDHRRQSVQIYLPARTAQVLAPL